MKVRVTGPLLALTLAALTWAGLSGAEPPAPKEKPRGPVKLTEEALRIHREAIVIDGHTDLPWQFREKADLSFRTIDRIGDFKKSSEMAPSDPDGPKAIERVTKALRRR